MNAKPKPPSQSWKYVHAARDIPAFPNLKGIENLVCGTVLLCLALRVNDTGTCNVGWRKLERDLKGTCYETVKKYIDYLAAEEVLTYESGHGTSGGKKNIANRYTLNYNRMVELQQTKRTPNPSRKKRIPKKRVSVLSGRTQAQSGSVLSVKSSVLSVSNQCPIRQDRVSYPIGTNSFALESCDSTRPSLGTGATPKVSKAENTQVKSKAEDKNPKTQSDQNLPDVFKSTPPDSAPPPSKAEDIFAGLFEEGEQEPALHPMTRAALAAEFAVSDNYEEGEEYGL